MSYNKEEQATETSALFHINEERILWGRHYISWGFGWMISPSKKFYIFYVVCVLIPLIVTDSVVFLTTAKFDRERREHEMSNIASAVEYSLSSMIGNAGEIGNSIYTNRDFEEFLSKRYTNSAEYVAAYQNFLSGTLLENALGMNSMIFTLYTDNDTIVNGGRVNTLDKLRNTESYLQLNEEAKSKGLFLSMMTAVPESQGSGASFIYSGWISMMQRQKST